MIAFECWWKCAKQTLTAPSALPAPAEALTPEIIFHTYAGRVYNLARRMLGNEADAEDVTQEVLLQVVRKLDSFRHEAEISTWLHRVSVNAVLAHRRKRAYRPEFQATAPLDSLSDSEQSTSSNNPRSSAPDDQALRRETREAIEGAIGGLRSIYRDVLVLADVEQLTNPEIAEVLGLSLPAVKSRLHRARQLLRGALGPHFGEVDA